VSSASSFVQHAAAHQLPHLRHCLTCGRGTRSCRMSTRDDSGCTQSPLRRSLSNHTAQAVSSLSACAGAGESTDESFIHSMQHDRSTQASAEAPPSAGHLAVELMASPGLRRRTRRSGLLGRGRAQSRSCCPRGCWQGWLRIARWVLTARRSDVDGSSCVNDQSKRSPGQYQQCIALMCVRWSM